MENLQIKQSVENQNHRQYDCKVIPLEVCHQNQEITCDAKAGGGLNFNKDFLDIFSFIPVTILIAVFYPLIYFAILGANLKTKLKKTFHSISKGKRSKI